MTDCPSPTAAGREDRCGLFSFPPKCDGGHCTMSDVAAVSGVLRKPPTLEEQWEQWISQFDEQAGSGAGVSDAAADLAAFLRRSLAEYRKTSTRHRCGHHPDRWLNFPTVDVIDDEHAHLTVVCPDCFPELFKGQVDADLRRIVSDLRIQMATLEQERVHAIKMMEEAEGSEGRAVAEAADEIRKRQVEWREAHVMDRIRDARRAYQALAATMSEEEFAARQMMAEVEATALLDSDWTLDRHHPGGPAVEASWQWNAGPGWLTIYAPGHRFGDPDLFVVHAAFSGNEVDGSTEVKGVTGTTATQALVNAINSLTEQGPES